MRLIIKSRWHPPTPPFYLAFEHLDTATPIRPFEVDVLTEEEAKRERTDSTSDPHAFVFDLSFLRHIVNMIREKRAAVFTLAFQLDRKTQVASLPNDGESDPVSST